MNKFQLIEERANALRKSIYIGLYGFFIMLILVILELYLFLSNNNLLLAIIMPVITLGIYICLTLMPWIMLSPADDDE